jgi:signal transduction histidine kinase
MNYHALHYHLDLVAFVLAAVVAMAVVRGWVRRRTGRGPGPAAWLTLAAVVAAACGLALYAARREHRRLAYAVSGLAPTYAHALADAGLAAIHPDTPPDDPTYLRLIGQEIEWEQDNPAVADIYTFGKRPDGTVVLLVDSETDYDRDGVYAGDREQRTPIGEEYTEDPALIARAFAGEAVFTPGPTADRWGVWISTYVPVRDDRGAVIGVLGVDYPADDWIQALLMARLGMLSLGAIVLVILLAALAVTHTLRAEVDRRRRTEAERERLHRQLMDASRKAGMAETAAGVLHNVGNVLNSVNVSAGVIGEKARAAEVQELAETAALLRRRAGEPDFLRADAVGRELPAFLDALAGCLVDHHKTLEAEVGRLTRGIDHIKEIVRAQQDHSTAAAAPLVPAAPDELVEEAVTMCGPAVMAGVALDRQFEPVGEVLLDRHRVLQILVNLITNAAQATEGVAAGRRVVLRVWAGGGPPPQVVFEVEDNGRGIAAENLDRIFRHGFTTRAGGHGFGLHSAANAAGTMGGKLTVRSAGPGAGATFTLTLPAARAGVETAR